MVLLDHFLTQTKILLQACMYISIYAHARTSRRMHSVHCLTLLIPSVIGMLLVDELLSETSKCTCPIMQVQMLAYTDIHTCLPRLLHLLSLPSLLYLRSFCLASPLHLFSVLAYGYSYSLLYMYVYFKCFLCLLLSTCNYYGYLVT